MTFPIHRLACPQKAADFYLSGYRRMQAAAPAGFTVLLGTGAAPTDLTANDYLIYGVTEAFIQNAGNLMNVWEPRIKTLCEQNGFLIYQAHPFRVGIRRTDPEEY